jgi:hypothetical protein
MNTQTVYYEAVSSIITLENDCDNISPARIMANKGDVEERLHACTTNGTDKCGCMSLSE